MRKLAAFLLCLGLLSAGLFPASARAAAQGGSAVISTTVPDSHPLTVRGEHLQVWLGGQKGGQFDLERLSEPTLLLQPEDGYKVTRVTLNGVDITARLRAGHVTLGPVYEALALAVETQAAPSNPGSSHDISGTVTDENGTPIPGATVEIGGKTDVTDETGSFQIPDVPDGYHTVTITDPEGNRIGYTEVEIGAGALGVVQTSDGRFAFTSPEGAGLSLTLMVTGPGGIVVHGLTDTTPDGPERSPQTGDAGRPALWGGTLLLSGAALLALLPRRKREGAE